jgi:predicted aldo/keto reductase-like oxidoreductase
LGINHIETARGYGTSEFQLGPVLKSYPRESLIVQTKVGPKETGKEFIKTVQQSLKNLELDHVDLLAVHGVNNQELLDMASRSDGTMEAALKLKKDGVCRHIGFSTHAPTDVIVRTIETNVFDYVNLHWYFVNEINWPAVRAARAHDMGVFIISPNDKGGKLYEPTDEMKRLCHPLTPMQFNDLYCLSRPEVHTLSIGAARPGDFDEHMQGLKWFEDRTSMTGDIAAKIRNEMNKKLGQDWCENWMKDLPAWTEIPGHVNVWEIVRLWNYATALGMNSFAKLRYNLLGQGDHWFPGVNAADFNETELLKSLEHYRFAERIPALLRESHQRFFEAPKKRLSES